MASVQFYGRKAIVQAYEDRGIAVWGLFNGKMLMTEGDSKDQLDSFLEHLEGNTQAEYKLCFYRDLDSKDDVYNDTPCTSAYNVSMRGSSSGAANVPQRVGMVGGGDPVTSAIYEHISQKVLAAVKKELDPSEDEDDGDNTVGGMVNGFMKSIAKDPDKLVSVLGAVRDLFDRRRPAAAVAGVAPQPGTRLGGAGGQGFKPPESGKQVAVATPEEKMQRIAAAFDRMDAADPQFLEHIEKMADVAEQKPEIYKMAIGYLNAL